MSSLRILLVDDNEAVRRGLRSFLAPRADWLLCGEAVDGFEAVEKARTLRPDVILMDISMPRMNGLDATRIIRRELPEIRVVIVSQNEATIVSRQAQEVDAAACVSKSNVFQDLLQALDALAGHRNAKSPPNQGTGVLSSGQNLSYTRFAINAPILNGGKSVTESTASQKYDVADARKLAEHPAGLLAAIVDSSDDAIVSKNLGGIVTSWNKGAERLFGYSAEEAIGHHITLIIPPAHWDEETAILTAKAGRTRRPFRNCALAKRRHVGRSFLDNFASERCRRPRRWRVESGAEHH